jgi:hypothetical protein
MVPRGVQSDDLAGGLRSTGGHPLHIQVQAFCQCGWTGPTRCWGSATPAAERADLAAHLAATGHQLFPIGMPTADGYHQACGHFHQLNDACPVPADSPRGRLERITGASTLCQPDRALDRLAAIGQLRAWLDDEEQQAAIGARMACCTWTEMGEAVGSTPQAARARWGRLIARCEQAGLLDRARTSSHRRSD